MASSGSEVNNYRGYGSLSSFSVILKNVDGKRTFNISSLVTDISIYEDIFAKTLSGVLTIKDGINLMNGFGGMSKDENKSFPIVGEEFIEISYGVGDDPAIFRRFSVYSISQIEIDSNLTSRSYSIKFCSEEALIDAVTLVQRGFSNQQISTMVETIAKDYLKLDQELENGKKKKNLQIQPTRGPQNIVVPRLTPLETMDFFAKRSIAAEIFTSGTYLFFENKDGFNFCDIEYLIYQGKKRVEQDKKRYTYYYNQAQIPVTEANGKHDPTGIFKTLLNMVQLHKFNTLEKLHRGYFESEALIYDFLNASARSEPYVHKFLDNYTNLNTLGQSETLTQGSYPENSIDFMKSVTTEPKDPPTILGLFGLLKDKTPPQRHTKLFFIPKDTLQPDTFLEKIYASRASYMARFVQNMFRCDVYGDTTIGAGDVIILNLPEISGVTASVNDKTGRKTDRYLSGYFMVTAIHHKLTPETYMCTYDMFKNGYSEPVVSTDNPDIPEPAQTSYLNNAKDIGMKK